MASVKDELRTLIDALPDGCDWDEALHRIWLRRVLEQRIENADQEAGIPHAEAKERIRAWIEASYGSTPR